MMSKWRSGRARAGWALALALGCTSDAGGYEVTLRFASDALRTRAVLVEAAVVPACEGLGASGLDAPMPLRATTFGRDGVGMELGDVPPGRVGLYARARDARCAVFAAGCREYDVAAGGGGALEVTLGAVMGPECEATELCVEGLCGGPTGAARCPMGVVDCDRDPANACEAVLATDPRNCGACGTACGFANAAGVCREGVCALGACTLGYGDCDATAANGCETDVGTSLAHCSRCGAPCTAPPNATARCASGRCAFTCAEGYADCDGAAGNGCEIDLRINAANCGRCGTACAFANGTPVCAAGRCAGGACLPGWGNCDGSAVNGCELDLRFNPTHCGACGATCRNANGTAACREGACVLTCASGFDDCNTTPADGCETDTRASLAHCGGCGRTCVASPNTSARCATGRCSLSCNPGFGDCDSVAANGCETDTRASTDHCGTCGRRCTATQRCASGDCVEVM